MKSKWATGLSAKACTDKAHLQHKCSSSVAVHSLVVIRIEKRFMSTLCKTEAIHFIFVCLSVGHIPKSWVRGDGLPADTCSAYTLPWFPDLVLFQFCKEIIYIHTGCNARPKASPSPSCHHPSWGEITQIQWNLPMLQHLWLLCVPACFFISLNWLIRAGFAWTNLGNSDLRANHCNLLADFCRSKIFSGKSIAWI